MLRKAVYGQDGIEVPFSEGKIGISADMAYEIMRMAKDLAKEKRRFENASYIEEKRLIEEEKRKDKSSYLKVYEACMYAEMGLTKLEFLVWCMIKKFLVRNKALMYMTGAVAARLLEKYTKKPREATHCTNALAGLVKKGFLYKFSNGCYLVNPYFVYKGDRFSVINVFRKNRLFISLEYVREEMSQEEEKKLAKNIMNELYLDVSVELEAIRSAMATKSRLKLF